MEGYDILKQLGKGAEGTVWKAVHKETGRVCAIKKINWRSFSTYEDCWNLAEVECLQKLHPHENILALHDVILEGTTLYLVLEFMEKDLSEFRNGRVRAFSEDEVRNVCFQILRGLVHMHSRGYCHRDLKPENLLVCGDIIKIADFGLAVNIQRAELESYVGTRLYRAPELILGCTDDDFAIDMWALGVIAAELFNGYPLFVGSNMEHLMHDICSVIGSPDSRTWHQGLALAASRDYRFPEEFMQVDSSKELSSWLPGASAVAIDFINSLLSWDPKRRPRAIEALHHPFFQFHPSLNILRSPLLLHDSTLPSHSEAIENDGHEHDKPCDTVSCFWDLIHRIQYKPCDTVSCFWDLIHRLQSVFCLPKARIECEDNSSNVHVAD